MPPFHLDSFSTNDQKLPSTRHAREVRRQAWSGGPMDRRLPAHRAADGALTAAFRFGDPPARAPMLPGAAGMLNLARNAAGHLPTPPIHGADQTAPTQERGRRRRVQGGRSSGHAGD